MPFEEFYKRGGLSPELKEAHLRVLNGIFSHPYGITTNELISEDKTKKNSTMLAVLELRGQGVIKYRRRFVTQSNDSMKNGNLTTAKYQKVGTMPLIVDSGWAEHVAKLLRKELPIK
jgi:hypothetical protein